MGARMSDEKIHGEKDLEELREACEATVMASFASVASGIWDMCGEFADTLPGLVSPRVAERLPGGAADLGSLVTDGCDASGELAGAAARAWGEQTLAPYVAGAIAGVADIIESVTGGTEEARDIARELRAVSPNVDLISHHVESLAFDLTRPGEVERDVRARLELAEDEGADLAGSGVADAVAGSIGRAFAEGAERARNRITDVCAYDVLERFSAFQDRALEAVRTAEFPEAPQAQGEEGSHGEGMRGEPGSWREAEESASFSMEEEEWLGEDEAPAMEGALDARSQILAEVADVDGHISFVEELLARCELTGEDRAQIERGIERVRRRQRDPRVTMAVVGEFSAGKSSFINALLREELFETDVVQGTTVASTVIEHGDRCELTLHRSDDLRRGRRVGDVDERGGLATVLSQYTSDVRAGEDVRYLRLRHPSAFLAQGVRVIDTPGTSSLNQWHDEVTRRTLRERADACIVLMPAVQALSAPLREFLHENLEDVLPTCVFVLTKIDLVRPRERERVVAYVRDVLLREFGLEDPLVLTYCSLPEATEFSDQRRAAEGKIVAFLRERRVQMQLQRCMGLLEGTLSALGRDMERISEERAREHERLTETQTEDLSSFIAAQRRTLHEDYLARVAKIRSDFELDLDDLVTAGERRAMLGLDDCETQDKIRAYLNDGLKKQLERSNASIEHKLSDSTGSFCALVEVREAALAACEQFVRAFQGRYRTLDALARELEVPVSVAVRVGDAGRVSAGVSPELARKSAENESADNGRFFGGVAGGAAAGAAIGSVVPGVGTALGAVTGAIVGLFGWASSSDSEKRADAFRKQVRPDVRGAVQRHFHLVRDAIKRSFGTYERDAWDEVEKMIDAYQREYGRVIEAMRERDHAEQERVGEELERIRSDRQLVEDRVELIRVTRERMRQA